MAKDPVEVPSDPSLESHLFKAEANALSDRTLTWDDLCDSLTPSLPALLHEGLDYLRTTLLELHLSQDPTPVVMRQLWPLWPTKPSELSP